MKSISFKTKLLGLCFFLSAVSGVIAGISYHGLNRVENSYSQVTEGVMPNLNLLNDMFLEYRSVRINLRSLGLPGLNKEESANYIEHVNKAIASYEELDKKYNDIPFKPGEKELYDKVHSAWLHFKEVGVKGLEYYRENSQESLAKLNLIFHHDCPEAAKNFTDAIVAIKEFHAANGKNFKADAVKASSNALLMIILTSLIGILFGLSTGFIFATKVSNTIGTITQKLSSNAEVVSSASSQIAASSQQLSQSTTEQAASLEETASALEEISSMISKAADSAENTATSSAESNKKAELGRAAVDQMLTSMDEISQSNEAILTQVNESNQQMSDIVKVIQEIGTRTKVINEIVFQTKLLSFNASVEAARAGEHGKGFAVVAEEVGNLAQMSGNAAKEISDMLDSSISKVEKIVQDTKSKVETLVHQGKEKVEFGVGVAKQCSDVLNEIVENVSKVSELSKDISTANKEQSVGVAEINKAMAQLDAVTQQNAATTEETASASNQLYSQADSLNLSVQELISVISGSNQATFSQVAAKNVKNGNSKNQSNVIALKKKPKFNEDRMQGKTESFSKAAGDGFSTPNREDSGFGNT